MRFPTFLLPSRTLKPASRLAPGLFCLVVLLLAGCAQKDSSHRIVISIPEQRMLVLEDGIIECSLHSGAFDVKTGAVKSPPCSFALRTYKVVLEGDDILVDLDKDAAGEPA